MKASRKAASPEPTELATPRTPCASPRCLADGEAPPEGPQEDTHHRPAVPLEEDGEAEEAEQPPMLGVQPRIVRHKLARQHWRPALSGATRRRGHDAPSLVEEPAMNM